MTKVKKPLDAICEAMWNDTTPEGSDVFRKIHKKGFWNFVSRVALALIGAFCGFEGTSQVLGRSKGKDAIYTTSIGLSGYIAQYLGKNWFKSDSDIAKLIRTGITRKNKNKK